MANFAVGFCRTSARNDCFRSGHTHLYMERKTRNNQRTAINNLQNSDSPKLRIAILQHINNQAPASHSLKLIVQ